MDGGLSYARYFRKRRRQRPDVRQGQRGGRADRPGRARAVPVLADVQERRLRRPGLQRPGPPGHPLGPRLRARLPFLGEHRDPGHPGLRVPLDPRRRDRRARAVGRLQRGHAADQPAADRLHHVLRHLPGGAGRLRPGQLLHRWPPSPVDRPDRRPGPADGRPAGHVPAARRPDPGDRDRPDQRQPRVPRDRLPGPDLQPVGRGVRLLLLRPLGPAPLLPGGRRQRRRHRGPELAADRPDLARERARRPLERTVLPVDAA